MPTGIEKNTLKLPAMVWMMILEQIPQPELVVTTFVCREMRALAIPMLYRRALFSEWNDEGIKFANALRDQYICPDIVSTIETVEVSFTSQVEAERLLQAIADISELLVGITTICVSCDYFEEAVWATNLLSQSYPTASLEIKCTALQISGEPIVPSELVKSNLTSLTVPLMSSRLLPELSSLDSLSVEALAHDPALEPIRMSSLSKLKLSYVDWVVLGHPESRYLELDLGPDYIYVLSGETSVMKRPSPKQDILIDSDAIDELRLTGPKTDAVQPQGPTSSIRLKAYNLRHLFICNIDPDMTEYMLRGIACPKLEFVSFFPVSAGALLGLKAAKLKLKLVLALINESSLENKSISDLVALERLLQDTASTYPTDLRDFSGCIDNEIYFSDGMWCNFKHTPYKDCAYMAIPELF